jgi:hypothetical protein
MKVLIPYFIFTLISVVLNGQSWQRLIENPFNFGGAEAYGIRVIDDTIFVSSVFVVVDSVANNRAVISKHSLSDGTILDTAYYQIDTLQNSQFNGLSTGFNQLYNSNSESIILPISCFDLDGETADFNALIEIDKNLAEISRYPLSGFTNDNYRIFNGSRIDYEGNLLIYGSRSSNGNFYTTDSAFNILTKVTPNGDQLWTKKYDDCYTINSLCPLADGDIIFNTGEVGTLVDTKFLIKADSAGNEK